MQHYKIITVQQLIAMIIFCKYVFYIKVEHYLTSLSRKITLFTGIAYKHNHFLCGLDNNFLYTCFPSIFFSSCDIRNLNSTRFPDLRVSLILNQADFKILGFFQTTWYLRYKTKQITISQSFLVVHTVNVNHS